MSAQNVLIGVLAGVAAGAILGVLFAPDKGSVTRKRIANKGHDMADGLKDKYDDLVANLSEKFEAAKKEAKAAFENDTNENHSKDYEKDHKVAKV